MVSFVSDVGSSIKAKAPPKPQPKPAEKRAPPPPAKPLAGIPVTPAKTIPYNPNAYVPGGSSTAKALATQIQGIETPGPAPVQVPVAVYTNTAQDIKAFGLPPGSTPLPPLVPAPAPTPAPTPAETPIPETGTLTVAQLEQLWKDHGGNADKAKLEALIALCESTGNTSQIHNTAYPDRPRYSPPLKGDLPEYSVGLWQINIYAHTQYSEAEMLTSSGNVKAEIAISGADSHNAAAAHVFCFKEAEAVMGVAGATTPPLSSGPVNEPASIQSGWSDLMSVLGSKVAEGLASITSNANALVEVFR